MKRFYETTPLEEPCYEHFVNWYEDIYKCTHVFITSYWDELPFTMQFGVYEEFFHSKGIDMSLDKIKEGMYEPVIDYKTHKNPLPWHLAKVEVVREAGERYNKIWKTKS